MPRGTDRYDEARLQRRLWTPELIKPDLGCWLDASDPSTITYATGVSSWRDKSGRGRNATQATGANQPTYAANPPRVVFSGNQSLATTLDGDTLWDVFAVARPAGTGYRQLIAPSFVLLDTGSANLGTFGAAFNQSGTRTWPVQRGMLYFRITFTSGSVKTHFARDGEEAGFEANAVSGSATPTLGNHPSGGQSWGDVYEFMSIVSSDGTSDTDPLIHKKKLEGYAAWRWAALGAGDMVGLLPGSHPFKNRPPLIGD
jgi:hypothetical protein